MSLAVVWRWEGGGGLGGKFKKRSDTRLYTLVGVYVPSVIHRYATRELLTVKDSGLCCSGVYVTSFGHTTD